MLFTSCVLLEYEMNQYPKLLQSALKSADFYTFKLFHTLLLTICEISHIVIIIPRSMTGTLPVGQS